MDKTAWEEVNNLAHIIKNDRSVIRCAINILEKTDARLITIEERLNKLIEKSPLNDSQ